MHVRPLNESHLLYLAVKIPYQDRSVVLKSKYQSVVMHEIEKNVQERVHEGLVR